MSDTSGSGGSEAAEKPVVRTCLNCNHASPHAREPYGACWCGCDNYLPYKGWE